MYRYVKQSITPLGQNTPSLGGENFNNWVTVIECIAGLKVGVLNWLITFTSFQTIFSCHSYLIRGPS